MSAARLTGQAHQFGAGPHRTRIELRLPHRVVAVLFAPESGLTSDIALSPLSAKRRHMQRSKGRVTRSPRRRARAACRETSVRAAALRTGARCRSSPDHQAIFTQTGVPAGPVVSV